MKQRIPGCNLFVGLFLVLQVISPHVKCFALHSTRRGLWESSRHIAQDWYGKRNHRLERNLLETQLRPIPLLLLRSGGSVEESINTAPIEDDKATEEIKEQQDVLAVQNEPKVELGVWPCGDALDLRLIKIALPIIANFAIAPLTGAVDVFWVSRMGNALAVAGQAASNQIFASSLFVASFLPSVTATLISKENASNNKDGVQDAVCQAMFVAIVMALVSNILLCLNPTNVLTPILGQNGPAMEFARPYLLVRAFAFVPSLVSLVAFSAFRGVQDTATPVRISQSAYVINAILDPILIFWASMGVTGAAIATVAAEVISAVILSVRT